MIHVTTDGETWRADAEVVVGVEHLQLSVDLGPMLGAPDPGGLHGAPVVIVPGAMVPLVRAGALRAGKTPPVLMLPGDGPWLGAQMLVAVAEGVEVIVVEDGTAAAATDARVLGGRPLPVIPFEDPDAVRTWLDELRIDVNLAVPASDEQERAAALRALAPFEPERRHHLVDVDPRPAFDELGWDPAPASPIELAAAAAGVLAGRLAAANRRWRTT